MSEQQNKPEKIGLAEVIRNLREELQKAQEAGKDEDIRFKVKEVEVELTVSVEEEEKIGVKGGFSAHFFVLTSHYQANEKDTSLHKIKLTLEAGIKDPNSIDSVSRPVEVSGEIKRRDESQCPD